MLKTLIHIQSFLNKLTQSLLSIPKIILWSRKSKLPQPTKKELVILGNGPSLQHFLKENIDFLNKKQSLAVNHFADTEIYTQIQPDFYVINVPEFWTDDVDDDVLKRRNQLIENLVEKTHWNMNLLLGMGAKKSKLWRNLSKRNPHLKIYFFNVTPIEGFRFFKHFCYRNQLGMPRPHNVLIPSLINAINMGFKKIYLAGADHNWMKEIFVADDNTVYLTQKHFYDLQTARPEVMKKTGKDKRKLHEILHKFMLAFQGYFDINDYSNRQNAQIINITRNSFIDAFKRQKL